MTTLIGPQKGEVDVLNVTKEAKHRVLIGLSWNPKVLSNSEQRGQMLSGIKDVLFGNIFLVKANLERINEKMDEKGRDENDPNHDLDLVCFVFDQDGKMQSLVDPDAWNAVDATGQVYHSGDDYTGEGANDDEQIHIELRDLPESIHEFFLVVQSDCNDTIDKVDTPVIRVCDTMSNNDLLKVNLEDESGNDKYGYVFCRIFRDQGEWNIKNISEFCDFEEDWEEHFKKYR